MTSSETGLRVTGPVLKGLSGGPIVDTDAAIKKETHVIGVFTEISKKNNEAIGESAQNVVPAPNSCLRSSANATNAAPPC